MNRLLGMYVHTHWSYNNPYAARTWSLDQWKGYLSGLKGLGYNLVQIWPMLDTMPVPPTPSDKEHLEKLAKVIEYAHQQGMTVYVGISPNTSCNDKAALTSFQDRNYFEVEALINPADKAAMDKEMERRRILLEPLAEADGCWILDCDPGGWKGSPVSEFVEILGRHREVFDRVGNNIRLVYWMWAGWTDKHRFDPEWTENIQDVWVRALEGLKKINPEPWAVHGCMPGHFKAIEKVGISDRAHFYPYNLVEYEPSYPYTNWEPKRIADAFEKFSTYSYPMGTLGNSQTHCVQIPHAYVFSHIAQGGILDDLNPQSFGERLLPGSGDVLAEAWEAMSNEIDDESVPRNAKAKVDKILEDKIIKTGELEGLFFGDVRRYLKDLSMQLELWGNILELKDTTHDAVSIRPVLKKTVSSLRAWNDRHGFKDRYHDIYYFRKAHPIYRDAALALGTPEGDYAAEQTDMFTGYRHGRTLRFIEAMEEAVKE